MLSNHPGNTNFARGDLQSATSLLISDLAALKNQHHWRGCLASSALSTATAVSALSVLRDGPRCESPATSSKGIPYADPKIDQLIAHGIQYLVSQQNDDGGWGDTDRSLSNIATTLLAIAALHLARREQEFTPELRRAWHYVDSLGRWQGLTDRYGKDKTFAVPILTNCALAGIVSWRQIASLPFEAAVLPQSWYRFVKLPVVSYAIPALVAIGQVKHHFHPSWNPVIRGVRAAAVAPSLAVLRKMQPASGGYLEAIPLTSFVAMSLAAKGLAKHEVVQESVKFLIQTVRDDGSWPIDSDLATWGTSLITASSLKCEGSSSLIDEDVIAWLLSCQHTQRHPFTGAAPGGWGWTDLSGAVPDADDTPAALIALYHWCHSKHSSPAQVERIMRAVALGLPWLLDLQNRDGGWPTFCRGWGTLPFDRSGSDLTAHAMRALHLWREFVLGSEFDVSEIEALRQLVRRIPAAIAHGKRYLERQQQSDGSWLPLWFGNQDDSREENKVYGTARVLVALAECGWLSEPMAEKGVAYLLRHQNVDGGWGGGQSVCYDSGAKSGSTVEEAAQAVEALARCRHAGMSAAGQLPIAQGLDYLIAAVHAGDHRTPQPIGFYFAKLWYHEQLYPLTYTLAAFNAASKLNLDRL